ncbi:MAG TPA: GNAT family N-acetyltransferase [Anaerolineae bacterium]|nr:GNAT family N-acetyltransferase [Anaerolineae bacterium]HMR68242.1 GNAT family N-acetyltransferase [Anaerolineae bacterium]
MTISSQKLGSDQVNELVALVQLYADVFETENFSLPEPDYLQTLLAKENIAFFVALANEQVIGGLTAYVLPSVYFTSSEVYLYDLAVKPEWQRKGVGKQLLEALRHYCFEHGYREFFVQADLEDQHAVDFYRATGGVPEEVIHFSYSAQERPTEPGF